MGKMLDAWCSFHAIHMGNPFHMEIYLKAKMNRNHTGKNFV
jgi:hypothetical protein